MNTPEPHPFFTMLADYHSWTHPFPLLAFIPGVVIMVLLFLPSSRNTRISLFIMAFFWVWNGLILFTYHAAALSPLLYAIQGVLFPVQALLFAWEGCSITPPTFGLDKGWSGKAGFAVMFTGLFLYPVAGNIFGHAYPAAPVFPEPCPLTIFTFGFLMTARTRIRLTMILIPFFWSLMGIVAVLKLGVLADALEVIAGIGCSAAILAKNRAEGR